MSKLATVQNWPDDEEGFRYTLFETLREIVEQVNGMSDMNLTFYTTVDAIPTDAGGPDEIRWKRGKTVQGAALSQYVMSGWQYVGGAWVEMQIRTGT